MLVLPFLFLVVRNLQVNANAVCKAGLPHSTQDPFQDPLETTVTTTESSTTISGPTICLPSPTNMITVLGTPDPSSVPFKKSTASWDSCVSSCSTDTSCLMVAQSTDTLNCVVYNYGDVWRVQQGGTGNVSIKVNKQMDKCFETVQELFNSENTFNSVAASVYNTYNILADAQNITFTYNNDTLGLKGCNDFLQATPQCSPATCLTTMIPYFGEPVPGYFSQINSSKPTVSWKECMTLCQMDATCFLSQMNEGNSTCNLYKEGAVMFIEKKGKDSGMRFAMKIAFTSSSCSSSSTDAVSGKIYKSPTGFTTPFYRIGSSDNYYGVYFQGNLVCPIRGHYQIPVMQGWYMVYYSVPTINYTTSNEMCSTIGDGLMPLVSADGNYHINLGFHNSFNYCLRLMVNYKAMFNRADTIKLYLGYTKVNGAWTWALPNLVTDKTYSVWATGQPANASPENTCAINNIPSGTIWTAEHYVEENNCQGADGFLCHMPEYSL